MGRPRHTMPHHMQAVFYFSSHFPAALAATNNREKKNKKNDSFFKFENFSKDKPEETQ